MYRVINTIALPGRKVDLLQIYTPLTLEGKDDTFFKLDNFDLQLLRSTSPKLVMDYAGMGKSTLLKYIYISCIKNDYKIPIFIELRKLKKDQSIEDYIRNSLSSKTTKLTLDEIDKLLLSGQCVLLLDGLDEVDSNLLSSIVENIGQIIDMNSNNNIVLSSRVMDDLSSLNRFDLYNIKTLTKDESINLLIRYGLGELEYVENLVSEVKLRYNEISNLLGIPLTASLLFKVYQYKNYIPLKKNVYYKQVYDALYESHDLSKEIGYRRPKESNLDLDEMFKACCILGYITYKDGLIDFDRSSLVDYISKIKLHAPDLQIKPSLLLNDLLKSVPFIVKDGNTYKWIHKSFQEFFAAQALFDVYKGFVEQALTSIAKNTNRAHENFLDFYYDIDTKGYTLYIIDPLIEKYKLRREETLKAYASIGFDQKNLREAYKSRRFAIFGGKGVRADEMEVRANFSDESDKLFMLSEGFVVTILVETFFEDMLWQIAARRKVNYVTMGMGIYKADAIELEELHQALLSHGAMGFVKDAHTEIDEAVVKRVESFINKYYYLEIDLHAAQEAVDMFYATNTQTKDLFDF